ncbi:Hsp20/alpha crystallin family protein [Geoalkalibacter subterraneus]|jgi:HSP20 family protein|uniref:Hsp20/alpha crystallin family protein n=1 Tax=Geoalkalibacter subterraneus TaxID=483547 RepID=UPI0006938767|nr:Hsp20/alpha crystallin family protein [Geoalkalibacter subterraneus]
MNVKNQMSWRRGERPLSGRMNRSDLMMELRHEIDRLFAEFIRTHDMGAENLLAESGNFVPTLDIKENEREVLVTVELPGMDEKNIEATYGEGMLTIRGEKREEKDDRQTQYYHAERHFGSFLRRIPITAEIDDERIEARYRKGVLEIRLPKSEAARQNRRKIEIRQG